MASAKAPGLRSAEALFGVAFLLLGLWSIVDGRTWLGIAFVVLGGLWFAVACSTAARRALLGRVTRLRG